MSQSRHLRSPRLKVGGRVTLLLAALLLAGIVWALMASVRRTGGPNSSYAVGTRRPRDVYADSPYLNVRQGVAYVGDEACIRCHREITEDYRTHPMGRSLAQVRGVEGMPPTGPGEGLPFESKGLRFTIEHRDGRVFHRATRRGVNGETLAEIEAEVQFTLGSGTRGTNFLIERDGFLSLSPIAWFAQQGRWGISPGYGEGTQQTNFERAIYPDCLFCHTNQVRPVTGPLNRYEPPLFVGHAIGCERCHGPGALHVDGGGLSTGSDTTIVNPADLAPALRESVCHQCHLQGAFRATRAGRGAFDFRPGLPMHRFWGVFQFGNGSRERSEAVGHVEQLESSRCFRESLGQLGCISCHDPHKLPEPATKVAYYRERCLECHQRKGCSLPPAERRARGPGEDCIACHMRRLSISNIPHTAATDHRIPRGVDRPVPEHPRSTSGPHGENPLLDYFAGQMTAEERLAARRDLGVASAWVAGRLGATSQLARIAATQSLPLLEEALRDRPDDLAAGNSLGAALEGLGRPGEALRAFEAVLRIVPDHELALRSAGSLAGTLRRDDLSRELLRRTIAVNPWRSDYRMALAKICLQAGDWPGAVAACVEALRLNPDLVEARSLLVECYLRSGERAKADAEFQTLLRFYPAAREAWLQWYEGQKQTGRTGVDLSGAARP